MGILGCYYVITVVRGKSASDSVVYFQNLLFNNSAEKSINTFVIVYTVKPTLNYNKRVREKKLKNALDKYFIQAPCLV